MSIFSNQRSSLYGALATAALSALLLLLVGGPVFGEDPVDPKKGVCKADVAKFCGGIERGEGRIRQCLQENRDALSAGCRQKLEKREKRRAAFDAACGADAKSLCGEKRGKELRACMKANREKVSAECKALISKARENKKGGKKNKEKRKAVAKACRADARKLCKGIKPGDGKLMACLQEKRSELSSACQSVLPEAGEATD